MSLLSAALFLLAYLVDNKYTTNNPPIQGGVLVLDEATLQAHPIVFLIDGWEIYRDVLLSPADFSTVSQKIPRPDEYVYIGQYGGFEGNDPLHGAHGSATYRLRIAVPDGLQSYMLELTEIFSAYTLYVNGVQVEQFGNPEPQDYLVETGAGVVTFVAEGTVEIIVAVSDFSHFYSGIVYPPAFGTPTDVTSLLATRFAIRAGTCTIAVALALFFLLSGLLMRHNRMSILYGLICLTFVGYTCYPVAKTINHGGLGWYGFENFCFVALLLLVSLLLRRLSGDSGLVGKLFLGFGGFICACTLARALLPGGELQLYVYYSSLIGIYKWMVAVFLTVGAIRVSRNAGRLRTAAILMGIVVFDVALIMDRMLPLFEPIRFGWFLELAAGALVVSFGVMIGQDLLATYREKSELEVRVASVVQLVDMQRSYYPAVLAGIEETRRARHDLRHHLRIISSLAVSKQYQELADYLGDYQGQVNAMTSMDASGHPVLDAIFRHFAVLAQQSNVTFTRDLAITQDIKLDDADLSGILSNLLENAFEACAYLPSERYVSMVIKQVHNNLVVIVENSFDGTHSKHRGVYQSRKRPGAGVGLESVRAIAERAGGTLDCESSNTRFVATVVIP
jgi:signal transduction histidine kinase